MYQPPRQTFRQPINAKPPKRRLRFRRLFVLGGLAAGLYYGRGLFYSRSVASVHKHYSKSQTVCLDPGHGGDDPGAQYKDLSERDINLTVAQHVQELLESQGYQVFMTRTTNDQTLINHDRYTYCNDKHATIMVSIHHNYFDDNTVDYGTALFYKDSDQDLASSIINATAPKLGVSNNGITSFEDGVLSKSNMPAALSEAFFITDDDEYDQVIARGSSRLNDEAAGIAEGIENYFTASNQPKAPVNNNPAINHDN